MRKRNAITIATLMSLAPLPVLAQDMDWPGAGPGFAMTARARFTAATGQTVPKPSALDPLVTGSIRQRNRVYGRDDAIMRGICGGCLR